RQYRGDRSAKGLLARKQRARRRARRRRRCDKRECRPCPHPRHCRLGRLTTKTKKRRPACSRDDDYAKRRPFSPAQVRSAGARWRPLFPRRRRPRRTPCSRRLFRRAARTLSPAVPLNGWTLPWRMNGDWKEFHLVAEPVEREFAPGMTVHLWGYNGQSPGPTIETVEGDKVRIFVTNRLPEHTTVHWHGMLVPNG